MTSRIERHRAATEAWLERQAIADLARKPVLCTDTMTVFAGPAESA